MTQDARFEDADEAPIRLKGQSADDVPVLSALIQDAVLPSSEMSWLPKENRFGLLLNRYRWEKGDTHSERVQTVMVFDCVNGVKSNGIDSADKDQVLSVLAMTFEETDAPAGKVTLQLAGMADIELDVECLDVTLQDATRPYIAPSKQAPKHSE